ncbi:MAG: site-specific DNA-methyltransferase [Oscillospiraceae bacterium]|nr:site-specific DNA-methyltransferase [Oscillospiraceae bacterium]
MPINGLLYKDLVVTDHFNEDADVVLECNDSIAFTRQIPSGSVQLIITSPPYNIGKSYETKVSIKEYLDSQIELINKLIRILKPSGSICWQVGNYVEKSEVYPLDIYFYPIFKDAGLKLRNRIIWHFGHGLHASKRFSGRYETLLWFTKSDEYVFNLDSVRIPSKYPNKRHFKGDKKGELSGNPMGKNPSDFWGRIYDDFYSGLWDIPNVKSNHIEKTEHPCQYPVELVERCVLAMTNENDIVFDPYVGVASTIIAAVKHNRKAFGVDRSEEYIKIGMERVQTLLDGTLQTRPIGKPVYTPTGKEKITQVPLEWIQAEGSAYKLKL